MLFCVAMKDQIVSPDATLKLASRLKSATIKRLETSQHEALMEVDPLRKEFWDAFDGFVH
jgi:lysophospholipase